MPNLIQSIMEAFGAGYSTPVSSVAQDRYMRTPILIQPQPEGVGAHFENEGNPAEQISKSFPELAKMWKDKKGYISIANPESGSSINHEVAHRIYDQAELGKKASALLPFVPKKTESWIRGNPLYSSMVNSYGGSPQQITDESLGYAFNSPEDASKDYVAKVASMIRDPGLKNTLIRMFNNREAVLSTPAR